MAPDEIASDRVHEADDLMARGATYSGFVRLGEALRFVNAQTKGAIQYSWREIIIEKARGADLATIRVEAAGAVSRIFRLVSTSGTYDHYEIVLLLTLRIGLESAESLLGALGQAVDLVPTTLDDDIRALCADRQNQKAYQAALSMLRRNWGFPIQSEWLAK